MSQQLDIKSARIATEKLIAAAPTAADHAQLGRLVELEVKISELKIVVARINAVGGIVNSAASTALAALVASL